MASEPPENFNDILDETHYAVESVHHFHGTKCLCGFQSHVSRDRTKHIVTETLVALGVEARDAD